MSNVIIEKEKGLDASLENSTETPLFKMGFLAMYFTEFIYSRMYPLAASVSFPWRRMLGTSLYFSCSQAHLTL